MAIGSKVVAQPKEVMVPISKELLLKAVEGKAASRLLASERTPNDEVVIRYLEGQDERQDNLHKQSIRSEVKRLGGDDWKIHIQSMGESGFLVEVRPAPGAAQTPPAPEYHPQVEPGPVTADQEIDLEDPDKLKVLVARMRGDIDELAKLLGGTILAESVLG